MSREMGAYANLLNADRQAFIKAMLTKRGESGSTLTVICGQATPSCSAFFQLGRCPMTEAGWTREKPTKNGWYWWRFDASTSATIVRIMVCGDGSLAEMSNNGHLLLAANFDGEWLGPITPDSYQQGRAAGLREAHVFAMEVGAFYTAHRIGALIDKAQQAQEGK